MAKDHKHMQPMTLHDIHDSLRGLLAAVTALCEESNIECYLIGRGYLGIVRHQHSFVPWDDDLDIAVWARDMSLFLKTMERLPPVYQVQQKNQPLNPTYYIIDTSTWVDAPGRENEHMGVFLDAVPMMIWRSLLRKRCDDVLSLLARCDSNVSSQVFWKNCIKRFVCRLRLPKLFLFSSGRLSTRLCFVWNRFAIENKAESSPEP